MDLQDKVAVITGGASGLGRATAEAYLARGAKVAIFDLNEELAQNTAAELGSDAAAFTANVAEEESVQTAVAGVMERF
ncbi:MAG: SDR family NAD(P)-dependent oxidoreductase, partial [Pseudomonadales bacterium]|nr:SDR family NAD(P)-dependent oxidoreductase [Pseudomonadales bacterium]